MVNADIADDREYMADYVRGRLREKHYTYFNAPDNLTVLDICQNPLRSNLYTNS